MSRIALERIKDHGGMYDLVCLVLFGNRGEEENGSQESCSLSIGDSRELCPGEEGGSGAELWSAASLSSLLGKLCWNPAVVWNTFLIKTLQSASVVGNEAHIEDAVSSRL